MPEYLSEHFDDILRRCAYVNILPTFLRKVIVAMFPQTYRQKVLSDMTHIAHMIAHSAARLHPEHIVGLAQLKGVVCLKRSAR